MRALNAGRNDNSVNNFSWDNKALGKEKILKVYDPMRGPGKII
jgi:hypothetical protein